MVMFTSLCATIVVLLFNKIYIWYALLLCLMTAIGSYPGVICQALIVKKTGKQQWTVLILLSFIVGCAIGMPLIGLFQTLHKQELGLDVMEWGRYCPE